MTKRSKIEHYSECAGGKPPSRAKENPPRTKEIDPGRIGKDSGDNRLSRKGTIMGLAGLTAVFGMGTGVTPPVWSPEMYPAGGQAGRARDFRGWSHTKPHTVKRMSGSCSTTLLSKSLTEMTRRSMVGWPLVLVMARGMAAPRSGWSSCLAVRTGRLKRSPALHARPIDLVVFQEPTHFCWKPHLGGGFALRCLQRLSCPDLATRRCPERDSRHTRGRSSPILSY